MSAETRRPSLRPLGRSKVYIKNLEIENARCFGEQQSISFADPSRPSSPARWSVIVGENGTGKTTVLRALALLALDDFDELRFASRFSKSRNLGFFDRHKSSVGSARIVIEDVVQKSIWKSVGRGSYFELEEQASFKSRRNLVGYGASRSLDSDDEFLREMRFEMHDRSRKQLGRIGSLFFSSFQLRHPANVLFQWDYAERIAEVEEGRRSELLRRALTSGVLPRVKDIHISSTKRRTGPTISFETEHDGPIDLEDMSLGLQIFAAFTADFASRLIENYDGKGDPLDQPSICLVDEIDLHMHPAWQRTVMDDLSQIFPSTQFIVTAHSPLFVQAAEGANLVLLRRNPSDPSTVIVENDKNHFKA
jgi:predicted ATP-binding protein involved in virulence